MNCPICKEQDSIICAGERSELEVGDVAWCRECGNQVEVMEDIIAGFPELYVLALESNGN